MEQGLGLGSGSPLFNRHVVSLTRFIKLRSPPPSSSSPPPVLVTHARCASTPGAVHTCTLVLKVSRFHLSKVLARPSHVQTVVIAPGASSSARLLNRHFACHSATPVVLLHVARVGTASGAADIGTITASSVWQLLKGLL